MGLWSKLTGGQTADSGRTARDRARRAREISTIDKNTATWLRAGGLAPKKRGQ